MLTWLVMVWKATYAQAAVGLALSLAPQSGVSRLEAMQLATVIHEECTAQGVRPEVGVAIAMQESRFIVTSYSSTGDLGAMQVNQANLFVKGRKAYAPAAGPWDIWTPEGSAAAGCRAAGAWKKLKGVHWIRNYNCGGNGSRCVGYEREVLRWLAKGGRVS